MVRVQMTRAKRVRRRNAHDQRRPRIASALDEQAIAAMEALLEGSDTATAPGYKLSSINACTSCSPTHRTMPTWLILWDCSTR
ncbi:MAG: hypothetical protein A3G20_01770 [Acidobacteria bacterium RIFCSPLOWO2_12_FULL_59_11]|nr:MAG: hypothetical protein A3G20_01770 [Acidobacteria bacterium RIFCSPLOWO2_12_FULL_59_11]